MKCETNQFLVFDLRLCCGQPSLMVESCKCSFSKRHKWRKIPQSKHHYFEGATQCALPLKTMFLNCDIFTSKETDKQASKHLTMRESHICHKKLQPLFLGDISVRPRWRFTAYLSETGSFVRPRKHSNTDHFSIH